MSEIGAPVSVFRKSEDHDDGFVFSAGGKADRAIANQSAPFADRVLPVGRLETTFTTTHTWDSTLCTMHSTLRPK
jgi:hypothetical protein